MNPIFFIFFYTAFMGLIFSQFRRASHSDKELHLYYYAVWFSVPVVTIIVSWITTMYVPLAFLFFAIPIAVALHIVGLIYDFGWAGKNNRKHLWKKVLALFLVGPITYAVGVLMVGGLVDALFF